MYAKALLCKEEQLAAKVYARQAFARADVPTLYREVQILLKKYNLPENCQVIQRISKNSWKRQVKKAIFLKANEWYLSARINKTKHKYVRPYKEKIQLENYLTKLPRNYACAIFKLRYLMIDVKCNFKSNHESLLCDRCDLNEEDDLNHILICPRFKIQDCLFGQMASTIKCKVTYNNKFGVVDDVVYHNDTGRAHTVN